MPIMYVTFSRDFKFSPDEESNIKYIIKMITASVMTKYNTNTVYPDSVRIMGFNLDIDKHDELVPNKEEHRIEIQITAYSDCSLLDRNNTAEEIMNMLAKMLSQYIKSKHDSMANHRISLSVSISNFSCSHASNFGITNQKQNMKLSAVIKRIEKKLGIKFVL